MIQSLEGFERSTPEQMRYWGGFLDEALYFDITEDASDKNDYPFYNPVLAIRSTNKPALVSLAVIAEGKVYPSLSNPGENDHLDWALSIRKGITAHRFISVVKPYLHFRQLEAQIFDDFVSQKPKVIKAVAGLAHEPRYKDPEDRLAVEQEFRKRLLEAKSQIMQRIYIPEPERLAGILDTRLALGIYVTQRQDSFFPEYQAQASLVSVHQGLLDGLYQEYGGTEPVQVSQGVKRYIGPSYNWQISGQGLIPIVDKIEPYLIFRRREYRLLLDFLRVKTILGTSSDPFIQAQTCRVLQNYTDQWQYLTPHNI